VSVDSTVPAPQRLTFPPGRRVRRKVDFEAAYKRGRRFSDSLFTMTVRANDAGGPRLGLAVAARTIGNAIARNRLRRMIRESFRHEQHRLPAADIIVGAKVGARHAPDPLRRQSLAALWNKIASQCAPSSTP
jgi:ribonuclease P protein component